MLLNSWLPGTLRAAGIKVVETSGWTSRSHGQLPDKIKVVWHHDASPPGDSPGALNWMISNWNNASAQCWVDRQGTWHLVGTGIAWHAGTVKSGMPDNFNSIGIETDHTTAELWPRAQLDSLRAGTAAIFKKQAVGADWLHFHKTICAPTGRKSDPDGLDLNPERIAVGRIIQGTTPPPTTTPPPPSTGGNWLMALTDQQQTELYNNVKWLRDQLAAGIGPGQKTVGSTIAATLGQTQTNYNAINKIPK